jgi:transcriptional regulator with XRE-family HTH domain
MKIVILTNGPAFANDAGGLIDSAGAIRAIRRRLGMTAREFGAYCLVSGRTVNGWEQGRTVPKDQIYFLREKLTRRLARIRP